ncbi:MAG TPA: hypothetical protein VFV16_03075 [Candidatus Nitrosotalea sp.]|nr:hypothetical protein [Candidatus Nitrosotalea sp.]
MDSKQAEEIARTFLSQNYSVVLIEKSELVNQTWTVDVLVSSYDKKTVVRVKIDDRTRHIIGFE